MFYLVICCRVSGSNRLLLVGISLETSPTVGMWYRRGLLFVEDVSAASLQLTLKLVSLLPPQPIFFRVQVHAAMTATDIHRLGGPKSGEGSVLR